MLVDIAGVVAPTATTLAACMTAANLGPRLTGWGFVVFTVGAIAWGWVGVATGQSNLVWQNAILLVIDVIGVWRWLGREASYAARAAAAEARSRATERAPDLLSGGRLTGLAVVDASGCAGETVDAMVERETGRVAYLMVREGGVAGVGERLRRLDWAAVRHCDAEIRIAGSIADLPLVPATA